MYTTATLKEMLAAGKFDKTFSLLYSDDPSVLKAQAQRYAKAADEFTALFKSGHDVSLFSAPGRTEVGGNHTDHQHGCVLAASVNLDVIAIVEKNDDHMIRVKS